MTGAPPPSASPAPPASPDGADPSMEEILASIRRILNDDDVPAVPPAEPEQTAEEDDVLILDETMMVADASSSVAGTEPHAEEREPDSFEPATEEPFAFERAAPQPATSPPHAEAAYREFEARTSPSRADPLGPPMPTPDLLGPEAAAATAFSVGSLVRTLAAGRSTQVYGGGPTLEDMVRAELRPLLKEWLDAYLPPMVERLVRAEIERVVGRAVP